MQVPAVRGSGARFELSRVLRLIVVLLVFGAAWTLMSRLEGAPAAPSGPPPNPRQGFFAPEFSLDSLDGSRMVLSDLRGSPVVVNAWASWCLPCRTEMPAFERIHQSYKERGLIIVGVNMTSQDSEAAARAFVEEHALTFPVLLDRDGSMQNDYQIRGLPSTYFVGRDGVIRAVVIGGPMSEAAIAAHIDDLLSER
jgi:peroxiredoxin